MIRVDIKRTSFFKELSIEQQTKFFDFSSKKIIPAIDTLYYTVSLEGDNVGNTYTGILEMLEFLKECKLEVEKNKEDMWLYSDERILIKNRTFKLYSYCISRNDYFDIFIAKSLPNDNTPRIFVQLRSIGLWELGEYHLIKESFRCLNILLNDFNVKVKNVYENRIDYCYHTNMIQNPPKFFSDFCLSNNLKSTFTKYCKIGDIRPREITIDYLSLGKRQSNNLFFRTYNKVKEVVSQGYKAFFLELWFNCKMINYYDYFVYNFAYEKGNFNYIYEGIANFYLKFGSDVSKKNSINILLSRSDTTIDDIKKFVLSFMPALTQVVNIEFQSMRKFYYYGDTLIDTLPINTDLEEFDLLRLFRILDNRKIFLDYLTHNTVKFVKNNLDPNSECLDFWVRIQNAKLFKNFNGEYKRIYPLQQVDEIKTVNKLKTQLARLSIIKNNISTDINQDMSLLFGALNDNDVEVGNDGILTILDKKYNKIKEREKKKILSILKKDEKKENV